MAVETRVCDVQTWLGDSTGVEEGATNRLRAEQNHCKGIYLFLLYPKSISILGRKERTKHKTSPFALERVLAGNL